MISALNPQALLEKLRTDFQSSLVNGCCPKCGTEVAPELCGCAECCDRADRTERAEQFHSLVQPYAATLPAFPFATPRNQAWVSSVDSRLYEALKRWDLSTGMLILGPTGCGKTTAVIARIRAAIAEWRRAYVEQNEARLERFVWTTEADLFAAARGQKLGTGEPELTRMARTYSLLVVDEVGFQPAAGIPALAAIVDERYRHGLPTVITSGLTSPEFANRYSAAFVRRIIQGGGARAQYLDLFTRDPRGNQSRGKHP